MSNGKRFGVLIVVALLVGIVMLGDKYHKERAHAAELETEIAKKNDLVAACTTANAAMKAICTDAVDEWEVVTIPVTAPALEDDCTVPSREQIAAGALDHVLHNENDAKRELEIMGDPLLPRAADPEAGLAMVGRDEVVPVAETTYLHLELDAYALVGEDGTLYAYARQELKDLLGDVLFEGHRCFAKDFEKTEEGRFIVSALWEMSEGQEREEEYNVHLTGLAVHIERYGLPGKVKRWLSARLAALERQGRVIARLEKKGDYYHVTVIPDR